METYHFQGSHTLIKIKFLFSMLSVFPVFLRMKMTFIPLAPPNRGNLSPLKCNLGWSNSIITITGMFLSSKITTKTKRLK